MISIASFKLPSSFEHVREGDIEITEQDLGRLSIAGAVDLVSYDLDEERVWPLPLVLVDGRTVNNEDNHFYAPRARYGEGCYTLASGWDSRLLDPERYGKWHVYLGNGGFPSEAFALLFDEPIAYEQAAFDASMSTAEFPSFED